MLRPLSSILVSPNTLELIDLAGLPLNSEIDKSSKPTIVVFNKIDAYLPPDDELEDSDGLSSIKALKKSWMAKLGPQKSIFISAQERENMEELREILYNEVKEIFKVRYPYNNFLY